MRTQKALKRIIKEWQNNPLLVTGLYRLFTYITWEDIPEKYRAHFPPEAEEGWNDDLTDFKEEHILLDIKTEIVSVMNALYKRNITQAFSIVPIILADTYAYGKPIVKLQVALIKATNEFIDNVKVAGRGLAEVAAIYSVVDILKGVQNILKLKLNFNIDEEEQKIINKLNSDIVMGGAEPIV